MSTEYRAEIDGLRAIAVIPVVLFHAGVPGFSGGYVGVDVFFVISGFLITGILLRSVQGNRFSILEFYDRRIRRIFPALFTVLIFTTVFASWLLLPHELKNFGKSLFATSLFYANYHFMFDVGYFTPPAEGKLLLNMWSLAVEEQFYLLFPVYLYAVLRWFPRYLFALSLTLLFISLGYSIWLIDNSTNQAFYSAPARAWELLLGAVLSIISHRISADSVLGPNSSSALTLLGLAMIIVPIVVYSDSTQFPGALAIPPVLGSAIVIFATRTYANQATRLLSILPLRFIGLMSYSLYLWHWPVFVLFKMYEIEPLTTNQIIFMLVLAFVLAALSWRFIERPFRQGGGATSRIKVVASGFGVILVGVGIGAGVALSGGFPGRFSPEVLHILAARSDKSSNVDCRPLTIDSTPRIGLCTIGVSGDISPSFVVWGDSHAEALLPAISLAAREAGVSGLAFVRGGCPALMGVRQTRDGFRDCDKTAEAFMQYLAGQTQLKHVVLISRWAVYAMGSRFRRELGQSVFIIDDDTLTPSVNTNRDVFERGLVRTLEHIRKLDRKATVVSQVPEAEYSIPLAMARAAHLGQSVNFAPSSQHYFARQATVEELFLKHVPEADMAILRPERVLCPGDSCTIVKDGIPIYRDSNHLTRAGAQALANIFQPLFSHVQLRQN